MTNTDITVTGTKALWLARALGPLTALLVVLGVLGVADPIGAVSLACGSAAVAAVLALKPSPRAGWWLVASAMAVFSVATVLRAVLAVTGDLSAARNLLPDMVTLPGYFILGLGVLHLAAKGIRRSRAVIDALIASLSALAVSWLVLDTHASEVGMPLRIRLVLSLYVAASAFLLALVLHYGWSVGLRRTSPSTRALMLSMAFLFLGDVAMMVAEVDPAGMPLRLATLPYVVSFLSLLAALLHPSASQAQERDVKRITPVNLFIVAGALLVPVAVAATGAGGSSGADRAVLAVLLVGVAGLTVTKLKWALERQARTQDELEHAATHDTLTGLHNRAGLLTHLEGDIEQCQERGATLSVLFLDMDRFKYVNDTLGHRAGDELIKAAAQRIESVLGEKAMVARFGGDEFVLLAPGAGEIDALVIGGVVRKALEAPFVIQGTEVTIGATIGTASWKAGMSASGMLEAADTALYAAKEAGRGICLPYDATMRAECERRVRVEGALRKALERNELSVHFQPLVAAEGVVHGAEALVRWNSPELGQVSPVEFIPVAEETGMIVGIGHWVLEAACAQVARWREELGDVQVSVNVSARQLAMPGFAADVAAVLEANNLPGSALDLEITEGLLAGTGVPETLMAIRELGVSVAVDDFGTGYSSLSYLKRFPVSRVKIDQSFVRTMIEQESDMTLVKAVVAMADALGLETVAEGVETAEQAEALREMGVTYLQGYYFSKPLDARTATKRMHELVEAALAEALPEGMGERAQCVVMALAKALGDAEEFPRETRDLLKKVVLVKG
jgi:diguanylate cyclase (GGDEF)-like protein